VTDALTRFVQFIAWQNFVTPGVYLAWGRAILLLAAIAWVAIATGSLIADEGQADNPTDAFVMTFTIGVSIWAPLLFVAAALHRFRPMIIASVVFVLLAVPIVRGRSLVSGLRPGRVIIAAIVAEPWLWMMFVTCSLSALLPPYRWDETSYHLAQAEQWVHAGALTVDPYLRYPLNVCNWQIVQAVGLMVGGPSVVHLLTWLTGVLASLCVILSLRRLGVPDTFGYVGAIAFFFTPLVQSVLTVGMIDVPLMCWLTVAIYALARFANPSGVTRRQAAGAALCAGMFIGMKITALLFVPLFLILAAARLRRPALGAYAVVLLASAAPWYVRNTVLTGDPTPPVLGHIRHVESLYWSDWDTDEQAADLHRGLQWTPEALGMLPLRALISTADGPLRGWPLLGYFALLPLSIATAWGLAKAGRLDQLVAAWYGVVVWIATSYHLRYAMFLPLAAVASTYALWYVLRRPLGELPTAGRRWVSVLAAVALLVGPTLAAARYVKNNWSRPIPVGEPTAWLAENLGACEAATLAALPRILGPPARVYLVDLGSLKYYVQVEGYRAIGDDFHDGRWTDFWSAADHGLAVPFLKQLPIDAVVLCRNARRDRSAGWPALVERLRSDTVTIRPLALDSVMAVFRIRR
jgi:hypothetical protein